ncbi:MAG: hypothetical protein JSS65_11730 [Armatimonadetes bacterium]|nr:hypothetical protein [Armatimonadota bacterium]
MTQAAKNFFSEAFPTRSLAVLLTVGFVDLVATAVLHAQGQIVELNPLMRPLIERSEWLFAFVKGLTLVAAWYVMSRHAKANHKFVSQAAWFGTLAYVFVWTVWFFGASGTPK